MDARTTASPQATDHAEVVMKPEAEQEKISAYYSLTFPDFTYYLQTLSVTIGRRCIPTTSPSSSDLTQIDVDLGPLKSVSRLHAKIEYEEEEERFVLFVIGRNGAWVDGVWSGSGSKVPLSERSQIQIASRTFHFVLPPPPAPEDSPSPSSHSSTNRPRSPSVDITSISPPSSIPSRSPPPTTLPRPLPKIPPLSEPQLSNPNTNGKSKTNLKKRKKTNPEPLPMPKPEDMPPRPQLTYAQLCYRAIKAIGGKATLQEICQWIMEAFDWYKYNDAGWQSSVRHNLSSNRAFKKMERCADGRGKGFFWSVDEKFEHIFEEQEAKGQAGKSQENGGKDGKSLKKKDKGGASLLEPPLRRSVKGDLSGAALPPPLTVTPLALKTSTPSVSTVTASAPYPHNPVPPNPVKSEYFPRVPDSNPSQSETVLKSSTDSIPPLPPSLYIPIVVGPIPASHPSSSLPADPTNPAPLTSTAIVLHESTLILNPDVFSHLSQEQVKELESLGAQKALEILQGYIARFLKEQRLKKRECGRGRGRGLPKRNRGNGRKGCDGNSATGEVNRSTDDKAPQLISGPFTKAPLPPRNSQPQPNQEASNGSAQYVHSPTNGLVPTLVDTKPPVPVPMAEVGAVGEEDSEPIIIVDDSDISDAPAVKKRRLDIPDTSVTTEIVSG